MNFVADESVDFPIVQRLRQDGHQVWYVAEMAPSISDDVVLETANREAALLITADKDFGEMIFRLRRFSAGIILVRLTGVSPSRKASIVAITLKQHLEELVGNFSVISPGSFRTRLLSTKQDIQT